VDKSGVVEDVEHELIAVGVVLIEDVFGAGYALLEGLSIEDRGFVVSDAAAEVVGYFTQFGYFEFIGVLVGRGMVAKGMVQEGDEELGCVGGGDEGETRFGHGAHLVECAILHGVLRGHDVVAEIAAQSLSVFCYIGYNILSSKRLGGTPCLTITKLSNPSPTVMQALSYLLANTVGSHLASLESSNKNKTSCSWTNFSSWSRVLKVSDIWVWFVT
jgi:hypothetical protein